MRGPPDAPTARTPRRCSAPLTLLLPPPLPCSTEQKERQFREKVQRSTAMKLEAEMRAEGAALLDGLKGQLAHMAAVDYGVPTSPY